MSTVIHNVRSLQELAGIARLAEARGEQVVYLGEHSVRLVKYNALERAANRLSGQDVRQAQALDAFAGWLRQAQQEASGQPLSDRRTRLQALVGQTIDARVASQFVGQARRQAGQTAGFDGPLQFDGQGRLQALPANPDAVSELDLTLLESSVVQDLGRTNARGDRTIARTESECVLEMLGALRQARAGLPATPAGRARDEALADVEDGLRKLWLGGHMGRDNAQAMLGAVAHRLTHDLPGSDDLASRAAALAAEAGKDKATTQRHDNTFGRLFESSLAKHLVDQPSQEMLATADRVNAYLLNWCTDETRPRKHGYTVQSEIESLAKNLAKDPRPWHAEVPEIQAFLSAPSKESLTALMSAPVTDGFQMVRTYWMAAKVSYSVTGSDWLRQADKNYNDLVKPARSSSATPLAPAGVQHAVEAGLRALDILSRESTSISSAPAFIRLSTDEKTARLQALQSASTAIDKASQLRAVGGEWKPADRDTLLAAVRQGLAALQSESASARDAMAQVLADLEAADPEASLPVGSRAETARGKDDQGDVVKSSQYGTALPHQPRPEVPDSWQAQENIPARTGLNVDLPTSFEKAVLERNQNTVNGVSGTTNMLTFLLLQMGRDGALDARMGQPSVSVGDALAGNLAFLVLDGGHSIPEAMATSTSIMADTRFVHTDYLADSKKSNAEIKEIRKEADAQMAEILDVRRKALAEHVTDYRHLGAELGSAGTAVRVTEAVLAAFEHTRASFDALHQQRT